MPVHPKIKERLRKLWALAQDSPDTPECRTARRLYDKLLRKYGLSTDDVGAEPPAWHALSYKRGDKFMLARIILYFDFPARLGDRRQTIEIECTRDELRMLRDLYHHARGISEAKRKELKLTHESFMVGYLDRAFPRQWHNLPCPRCGRPHYTYSLRRKRFVCGACGHLGPKFRDWDGDRDAYLEGIRQGSTALPGNRLAGGEHPEVCILYYDERR